MLALRTRILFKIIKVKNDIRIFGPFLHYYRNQTLLLVDHLVLNACTMRQICRPRALSGVSLHRSSMTTLFVL